MKPYFGEGQQSPRPGCACCNSKYMHKHRGIKGKTASKDRAKRAGKKRARREGRNHEIA